MSKIHRQRKIHLFLKIIENDDEKIEIYFEEKDLVDIFSNLNIKNDSIKGRFLRFSSEKGYLNAVQLLLDQGASVEAKNNLGRTSLMISSQNRCLEIVKLILDRGALTEAKDNFGWTSLMFASQKGYLEIVKLFLDRGALVEAKDNTGRTALMIASENGHLEIVKMLLDRGALIEAKKDYSSTALMLASRYGHLEIVKLLLDHGALIDAKNDYLNTALILASRYKHLEIVKLLMDRGAIISQYGHLEIGKLLPDDVKLIDNRTRFGSRTALYYVCSILLLFILVIGSIYSKDFFKYNTIDKSFSGKVKFFKQQLQQNNPSRSRVYAENLNISVRRSHVLEDSFLALRDISGEKFKKARLLISFLNEFGIDSGGLTREWYSVLVQQIFNQDFPLFQTSASDQFAYQPNPMSHTCLDNYLFVILSIYWSNCRKSCL